MGIDVRASDVVVDDVATLLDLVAAERVRPGCSFGASGLQRQACAEARHRDGIALAPSPFRLNLVPTFPGK